MIIIKVWKNSDDENKPLIDVILLENNNTTTYTIHDSDQTADTIRSLKETTLCDEEFYFYTLDKEKLINRLELLCRCTGPTGKDSYVYNKIDNSIQIKTEVESDDPSFTPITSFTFVTKILKAAVNQDKDIFFYPSSIFNMDKLPESTIFSFLSDLKRAQKKEYTYLSKDQKLLIDLRQYIKRIESHREDGHINFSHGFWIAAKSRSINRKANYLLAKRILSDLEKGMSLNAIFQNKDANDLRLRIVNENNLNKVEDYRKSDIKYSELNKIIKRYK